MSAGQRHTCALSSDGAVYCWGLDTSGQLGDGTITNRPTPVAVSGLGSGVAAISAGYLHTCAVVGDAARCWGLNTSGQLGDGTTTGNLTPVAVSGLGSGVAAISASYLHTCAVVGDAARCWGLNTFGQLGDGTNTNRNTPVPVVFPDLGAAPTISNIADQSTGQGTPAGPIAFSVGDAETAAGSLTLSAASSNPALLPVANISFGGSGADRTVTLTPAAGQTGSATITITVSDGGLTASDSFVLNIVNELVVDTLADDQSDGCATGG